MRAPLLRLAVLVGVVLPAGGASQDVVGGAAAEVVAIERAFAARVREAGVKAGFTEYLAPDGVIFRPGPVDGLDYFAERPASAGLLSWRPSVADLSAAADLGYSTGPFEARATPEGPVDGTGWYLSVWRRQPNGLLRLVADHGAAGQVAPHDSELVRLWPAGPAGSEPLPDLQALDTAAGPAAAHDLVRTVAVGTLHAGAAARAALFGSEAPRLTPLGSGGARSADLGYTYGSYHWRAERGHYLRVWRLSGARWVVVAEVFSPAS